MADNITLNSGSGGAVLATDDITSVHYQIVKLGFGALNSVTIVDTSNALPVDLRSDNLSGNLDVNIAAQTGDVTIADGGNSITVDDGSSSLTVDDGGTTLSIDDGGGSITIDGTVTTELPTAAALADNTANPTVPAVGGFGMWYDGTTWDRARGDSTNGLLVNLGSNNDVTVSGTVDVGGSTVDTELPAAASLGDNTANPTVPGVGSFNMVYDGSTWDRAPGTSADGLLVNLGSNNDVTVTGTVDITELPTAAALSDAFANPTTTQVGSFLMGFDGTDWERVRVTNTGELHVDIQNTSLTTVAAGDVAHDSADSGNPVKVGFKARTSHPTAVANSDRVDAYADDLGRQVVYPIAPRDLVTHNRISLTSTTETTLIAAGGAGVLRDLVFLAMSNESATEVRVDIKDSTTGTTRLSIDLDADGGGAVIPLPVPLTQATANNNWTATLSAAVSTVYITAIAVDNN
jgi:hypothetical protein